MLTKAITALIRADLRIITSAISLGLWQGGAMLMLGAMLSSCFGVFGAMLFAYDHTPGIIGFLAISLSFGVIPLTFAPFLIGANLIREAIHYARRQEWPDGLWTVTRDRHTEKSPTTLWVARLSQHYAQQ